DRKGSAARQEPRPRYAVPDRELISNPFLQWTSSTTRKGRINRNPQGAAKRRLAWIDFTQFCNVTIPAAVSQRR
ncbi:MAG: hypothetical protein O2820_22505, partial [Planctomycetota bacterium]|nr:hypothetical protein [Planctomycetota bacterium]